jgi:nucleoside-diphosphate-sugar epimerase
MKLLLTGASGFLGREIYRNCNKQFEIVSIGMSNQNDIVSDLASNIPNLNQRFDIIVHAAGKAHMVPKTTIQDDEFLKVNFKGTENLCLALEKEGLLPQIFIFISSVAVYGIEHGEGINEFVGANPNTIYGKSKLLAEEFLQDWVVNKNVKLIILRLPLVVGSNPPGNLGKMILGIKRGTYFSIGGGKARKSMVLAEDVAHLIAGCPDVSGIYNLTDGYHPSFSELESIVCSQLKKDKPFNMPIGLAKLLGKIGDFLPVFPVNSDTINKILKDLTFSDLKARQELGWNPSRVIDKFKI